MAHNYIIQWNCRGLRSNREDIELLISKYSPAAICLQETMLKRDQIQTFKHYSAYYENSINGHGGVCVLVKNNFIHSQVLITDRVEIANTLGAAIEKSSSSNNYSKEFQSIKARKEKQKINFKTNKNLRYNKKFTIRDLKRSLKKSNNSSPGPDQIHYEILRHLPIETLHILLDIINETWKSDTFPESWREALIISIPKPGKDHFNPLNYRPIALTSCICKTVERMVNERLVWYLEKNGLLAKQQCGYRANRSTVDHLVRLETFIRDAFIQNQHLVTVFFDLQKAYDTTWKCGIL